MMTYQEMKRILLYCQVLGFAGLRNHTYAIIPELKINLPQQNSFIGARGNPAIFVTEVTYNKLKRFHEDWIPNITIAISHAYLVEPKRNTIDIIGILVHEAGHAFNVYGKIKNNEANAYVFEIETMYNLLKMGVLSRQFNLKKEDLGAYFQSRLEQYNIETPNHSYLRTLVDEISNEFNLDNKNTTSEPLVKIQIKLGFFKKNNTSELAPEKNILNQSLIKTL